MATAWIRESKDGVVVDVFVQPKAARDALVGVHGSALKIKVAAAPERGGANRAVERLLAGAVGIPAARARVVAGTSSRHKKVALEGVSGTEAATALAPGPGTRSTANRA